MLSANQMKENVASSFRDPTGFVYQQDGYIYRQINIGYKEAYDHLLNSHLYDELTSAGLLIKHEEMGGEVAVSEEAYKVIKPEKVPFISYPYEWSFSQLKDAALATLQIQKIAIDFGMTLKDSSSYNIQFLNGRPLLIDTPSFEKYREGEPWVAYRQFCQHFFAPLVLMARRDIRLNQFLRVFLDGIPLDLASSLLPFRALFEFPIFTHIYCHSKFQARYADKQPSQKQLKGRVSRLSLKALIDSLETKIKNLKWRPQGTEWADYYEDNSYESDAFECKRELISEYIDRLQPKVVWDMGANTGVFSRIISQKGIQTVSFDIDPACVEKNYLELVQRKEESILPLVLDLTNPSPSIGWDLKERMSVFERGPADTILALALIHHLAISNNVPLDRIAEFFRNNCRSLIIEFVPKSDPQVKRLLQTREDVFPNYTQEHFEEAFNKFFRISQIEGLKNSPRTLYLMEGN